jgi:2-oxoglutarate ferredoxin oxidoreductase subunit alpha
VREFISGNEAIVRGALRAGCNYVAGYPITPASSILNGFVDAFADGSGIVVQAEDEIAAIGQCIAASMCGARALTATSGPGLSLYSENIGFAQMVEAPLVIVDCQRMGPATGGATSTGEGDVVFARHVTSGSYPLPVLAAADVASAYRLTYRAFQIAERLRTPVIVLASKDISVTRQTADLEAVSLPPIEPRRAAPTDRPFLPYAIDAPADVPLFAPIGGPVRVRVTGSIHDECGLLTIDKARIARKLTHLNEKIRASAEWLEDVDSDLDPQAKVLIVSYGLPDGAARDATDLLRAEGIAVSRLTIYSLWPVPERALRQAAGASVRHVIIPELNIGLYAEEVRRVLPQVTVQAITRFDGGLIEPAVLVERVRDLVRGVAV